jgi:DNA modification methylase
METSIRILHGTATQLDQLADETVDLIVTSPPYPMIEMWDEIFAGQDKRIATCLSAARGGDAFALMHALLDQAWAEVHRVLKPGGIACINIGDATRTLDGDFQLYANHARILSGFLALGCAALPDILWRKPTNAPNKFMGSGMLPVGAYVTYEHEYILVLRKGRRREFKSDRERKRRRQSAFFWEERNVWFSDIWSDIRGIGQESTDATARQRSAAFPFELAHRLISMFSVAGDVVLDPFAGTGTTLAAALACGRNGVGVEFDETFLPLMSSSLLALPTFANAFNRERLSRHVRFAAKREEETGRLKYTNGYYGFPVVTSQERELLIPDIAAISEGEKYEFTVSYRDVPQADFVREQRKAS